MNDKFKKMKILNIITTVFIISLLIGSLLTQNEIITYKETIPSYQNDAQAGIGPSILLLLWWTINSILCVILFLIITITGIKRKKMKDLYTIINLILLVITFLIPIVFLDY